jgi:hypothetical protein
VAVIDVELATATLDAALPSKEMVAPDAKPVPVTVTAVPPAVEPEAGAIPVTVGATGAGDGGGDGVGADPMYV